MTKHLHLLLMTVGGVAAALIIAFVGSAGDAGAAPSLVANGNFDAAPSVASWPAANVNSSITWTSSEDGDANPASGAGTVARSAGGAGDGIASQCITTSGAGNYQIAGAYKMTPGGSGSQTASIDVTVYTDNACSTGAVAHPSGPLSPNGSWQIYSPGAIVVTTELSMKIELITHAVAQGDAVYFDKIALSNGPLDTPTPTNTATATNTSTPTNTATPTSTSTATNTPTATPTATSTMPATRTNTPVRTATPPPTDTPVPAPTDTPVQGAPPEAIVDTAPPPDDTNPPAAIDTSGTGDQGGADVAPAEGSAGTEGFPDSGYGPQPEKSGPTDAIAFVTFLVALVMLGAGFSIQRRVERDRE